MSGVPTVKFDTSKVTETVKGDLRKNVMLLEGIDRNHFEQVYDAALRSILAGRDLSLLYNALMQMNIDGMTKQRAGEIARLLNNKATVLMDREKQVSLVKQADWRHSGAPCEINPKKPTGQDAAHRARDCLIANAKTGNYTSKDGGKSALMLMGDACKPQWDAWQKECIAEGGTDAGPSGCTVQAGILSQSTLLLLNK